MGKYCCFFCPIFDRTEKELADICPTCGRRYDFVLTEAPTEIGGYQITKGLGRGYYGAAYIAEKGTFRKRQVLKVTPVSFYEYFSKPSFVDETDLHARLARDASHIVGIDDRFTDVVRFADGSKLACNVTVLEYVDGDLLREYANGNIQVGSTAICQIAIDLLRIRAEFVANHLNHNDLHDENLIVENLRHESRRPGAIHDTIRVKAIDLGSISGTSKSTNNREGDLRFIAKHVDMLLERLLASPDELHDRDFRTALALQGIVNGLLVNSQNARQPNTDDLVQQIEDAYYRASRHWRPWTNPLSLRGFADHYNAQTLQSWDVPRLLVDPANRWLAEVSKPGPQIITGMRGCGKTMLLRALDVHARAAQQDGESKETALERLRNDQFLGLFVSAQRLLDLHQPAYTLEDRLTRLFIYFSLQAVRALLHLKDIDPNVIAPGAHARIASAVADCLEGVDELRVAVTLEELEERLGRIAVLTSRSGEVFAVRQAPVQIFSHLAEQLRASSEVFENSTVLYLLDDVSTRYLELDRIEEILSRLLFQSPICAFKFTSEWQTIELGLQSPGRNHPIQFDRDVSVFDLGADVFQAINADKTKGNEFVERILQQRAQFHVSHPKQHGPRELLGDVSLEQVAREIATSNSTSKQRKQAYRGLSCLTSVCVGDIGDVIKLYEEILKRAAVERPPVVTPIDEGVQSDCFLALSARRLYDLDRRTGRFKNHALAFAEAAHELLIRSARLKPARDQKLPRLRQYSSIYVRVTADDEPTQKKQIDSLRDLIDAGVFVYTGGSPRTKTKDSNPIQQFKLSYRKIYGLAAFIGLADRDRFELSGPDLQDWLDKPDKEVLLRNQITDEGYLSELNEGAEIIGDIVAPAANNAEEPAKQASLFVDGLIRPSSVDDTIGGKTSPRAIDVRIEVVNVQDLAGLRLGTVFTGLGFEDRTLKSNQLISRHVVPGKVLGVRYAVAGRSRGIRNCWKKVSIPFEQIAYADALKEIPEFEGDTLIDISGLSKPLIFQSIRREISSKGRVFICLVSARYYYPLQKDLEPLFVAAGASDPLSLLDKLSGVLKGEAGPYAQLRLLDDLDDPTRRRALLAFASAKHERLFSLLDNREFDYIEVIAPNGEAPRHRVAQFAADFVCQNYQNASVSRVDNSSLQSLVDYLDRRYLEIYSDGSASFEVGLTGSKMQAVASAVLSARRKVAQAWYPSPNQFDEKRFSKGVGSVQLMKISIS